MATGCSWVVVWQLCCCKLKGQCEKSRNSDVITVSSRWSYVFFALATGIVGYDRDVSCQWWSSRTGPNASHGVWGRGRALIIAPLCIFDAIFTGHAVSVYLICALIPNNNNCVLHEWTPCAWKHGNCLLNVCWCCELVAVAGNRPTRSEPQASRTIKTAT